MELGSMLGASLDGRGIWKRMDTCTCMAASIGCSLKLSQPCSLIGYIVVVVQLLSCVWLFATPWAAARQASLSFTISWSLLKLMSTEPVMPSNYLILCHPILLLPSIFPSIRVFSSELTLGIRWPKYWSFASASVLPMNIQDWFPLGLTGLISLQSKGLLGIFSNTTVWKHQFFGAQPSLWSNSHIVHDYWQNHTFD